MTAGKLQLKTAIDIGSHSAILLIASEECDEGKIKLVPKIQRVEICKLGEDIYETGAISEEKLNALLKILSEYRSTIHALGASINEIIMTEAMRRAQNATLVIEKISKTLWKEPRIITGEEEAKYTYRAVQEWHGDNITTIDIGGGSTEFSSGKKSISVPVGALFLYKKMGTIPGPEYKNFIKETFKNNPIRDFSKRSVFLVGGTAVALGMVFLNTPEFDYKKLEGLELSMQDLETTITRIVNLSKELRAMLPGLSGGRSDIIICGLFWLRSVLERLHAESFKISTAGIRFGVLYEEAINK